MRFKFVGWCNDPPHDKIWGLIFLKEGIYTSSYMIFWGRRGKQIQSKIYVDSHYGVNDKIHTKQNRGYQHVEFYDLCKDFPDLERELSKLTILSMLKV